MKTHFLKMLALVFVMGLARIASAEVEGHDYSPSELQEHFAFIASQPHFQAAEKFVTKNGLLFKWGEMQGGQLANNGSPIDLFTLPFSHPSGKPFGYLVVRSTEWRLVLVSPRAVDGVLETRGYSLQHEKSAISIREANDVVPQREEGDLGHVTSDAWSAMSCAYVENFRYYWGCIGEGNWYGRQYDMRYREGTYWDEPPVRTSWRSCWYGSLHVCPYNETYTTLFPICGQPPSHPPG